MPRWFFISDLHGDPERYAKLFRLIGDERPSAVFMGGDLLPGGRSVLKPVEGDHDDFVTGFLVHHLQRLREVLAQAYPRVFLILGNDDSRSEETTIIAAAATGVWEYVHGRCASYAGYDIYGYACVPPTPFLFKDWERYDVSRSVDPGCVSPEEGYRSSLASEEGIRFATIKDDLAALVGDRSVERALFLFHSPPYKTNLDLAALDGKFVDHVPLDVHVGSVAIQRFIEERQPLATMHGHIHESTRLSGSWRDRIGRTHCFSAAHDGPELALVRFDPEELDGATRSLI